MVYTPEERKAARTLARAKWAAKNKEHINEHKRARRKECESIRNTDHERYMRKIGHEKQRRVKRSPEALAAYKRDWTKRKGRRALMKRYGLTIEGYEALSVEQEHACAICRAPQQSGNAKRRLAVDHCHDSGEVRGLLCHACNVSLGLMREDPKLLLAAVSYLHKHVGLKLKTLIG